MGRRLNPPYRTRPEAFPLHPPHHIINVDLLAIDRTKALPEFQGPRSVWRANRLIIVIIAIALIATASIVAGVVVGLKPKKGTANLASNGASPALSSSSTPSSTSQTPVASSLPIPDNLQLSFKSSSWIWLDQNGLSGVPAGTMHSERLSQILQHRQLSFSGRRLDAVDCGLYTPRSQFQCLRHSSPNYAD
ncbi:hypothetical protein BD779DRAFT_1671022 [Infundibulicybe gibba]|nr:hypothetical protein BD779DRAFT_1671022 [Infundibulicybe gibba]